MPDGENGKQKAENGKESEVSAFYFQLPAFGDVPGPRRGEYPLFAGARIERCKSCNAEIVWAKTDAGRAIPLSLATVQTRDGVQWLLSHFTDCPEAARMEAQMIAASDILDLGSDLSLRYRYFTPESLAHPAKLHLGLLAWLMERYTAPGETIADPMAGIGSTAYAALLQRKVILREIESRWLALAHENAAQIIRSAGMFAGTIDVGQADAREPWGYTADHIIFSPPYACETKRDPERRGKVLLERLQRLGAKRLHYGDRWRLLAENGDRQAGASGLFNFAYGDSVAQLGHLRGDRYWSEMEQVYTQALAALRPGGKMILVIKDHIKDGQRVTVADDTAERLAALGFCLIARHARRVWPLSLWQRRRKEQGKPIVDEEDVLVFTNGERI